MYDELVKDLREKAGFLTAAEPLNIKNAFAETMKQAADAIEELTGFVQEAERDRDEFRERLDKANDAIEELADRNVGKWIPVTERLPEKPEGYPKCEIRRTYYLVSLKSGCVKALGYEFDRDEWQITGSPVVAWMPLPEPPKEE